MFAFSLLPSTPPQPNPPPSPASTLSLGFVHVSFIVVPENQKPAILNKCPDFHTAHFLTRLETIWVSDKHSPTLLPSPGVAWLPNFSGNDLAGVHSPRGCTLPLCVFHFVSIPHSDFKHPGPSCCQAALPALVGEGAGALTLLPVSCGRQWTMGHSGLVSLRRSQGPYPPSTNSSLSVFQCPLQFLTYKLHTRWDSVGCSLCSSEDQLGVPAGHRENWALLPLTSLPSSKVHLF